MEDILRTRVQLPPPPPILGCFMLNQNKKPGTPDFSAVEMTQMVMPQFTNSVGTVFGGQIMGWIDICAAVSAMRHTKSPVVTASFDEVHFLHPIKNGYIVILQSKITAVFGSSMEIETLTTAENPLTGERILAIKAFCTFVSLDDDGKPKKAPPLIVETDEERKKEAQAKKRRELRLKHRAEIDRDMASAIS